MTTTATNALTPAEVARLAVDVAADKLAADIVMLDLRQLTVFADYFGPEEREFFGLERLWSRAPQVVRIL